ncbi:hypothetical protein [Galactobacter caseinivorans]|uniref:hypothetical protein n=1 Tax=Galactobacter caseinivorans TaxID=2676123 RepID=UPI002D796748|nr:hypothetical protein [Galactobacter caseinivorans]
MASPSTAIVTAAGLVGGYATARQTGNRQLGGAVLAAAGALAFARWKKDAGAGRATALTLLYVGAFGASHPLAKKLGAWESVGVVTAATALTSLVAGGSKASRAKQEAKQAAKQAAKRQAGRDAKRAAKH